MDQPLSNDEDYYNNSEYYNIFIASDGVYSGKKYDLGQNNKPSYYDDIYTSENLDKTSEKIIEETKHGWYLKIPNSSTFKKINISDLPQSYQSRTITVLDFDKDSKWRKQFLFWLKLTLLGCESSEAEIHYYAEYGNERYEILEGFKEFYIEINKHEDTFLLTNDVVDMLNNKKTVNIKLTPKNVVSHIEEPVKKQINDRFHPLIDSLSDIILSIVKKSS
jgi:hypothetical protein